MGRKFFGMGTMHSRGSRFFDMMFLESFYGMRAKNNEYDISQY